MENTTINTTAPLTTQADLDWADSQYENICPTQEHVLAFDNSANGARYLAITGVSMWENLGGDTLPATTEDAEVLR